MRASRGLSLRRGFHQDFAADLQSPQPHLGHSENCRQLWRHRHGFAQIIGLVTFVETAKTLLDPAELSGVQSVAVPVDRD